MIQNKKENRLANEKSPYLLQHAYNPVDWYPWGEEAFRRAKAQDKPIFLSIGYSACHWCHVMEHESFEDEEVAAVLNRWFISIKVDREERPDVDAVYLNACQAMTGSGGWPTTIVMTPDQKPFFAATYLPKDERTGSMGLLEVLPELARQWKTSRDRLISAGDDISNYLRRAEVPEGNQGKPDRALLHAAAAQFHALFDETYGGFGGAPKFPAPHNLIFLLRHAKREGDPDARRMAEYTLEQMYRGGIYDHVGGGFSRYSTDRKWLVPHFEKMLYDNALLSIAYAEAFRSGRRPLFETVVRETLDYVLREMTLKEGGFACSQDADSEGKEGKYYTFIPDEIKGVLGREDGDIFCRRYGVTQSGNFEGKSIPNRIGCKEIDQAEQKMDALRRTLYQYRLSRTTLPRDDKVLTSWSGLMAGAMLRAGRILGEGRYRTAGEAALRFLENRLTAPNGRLKVRWRDGEAAGDGHLDDYAYMAWARLEQYRSTLDAEALRAAAELAEAMCVLFSDAVHGGFFLSASDDEHLIVRPKEAHDGAMPSGNSIAALVLVRLWNLTGALKWQERADRQLHFLAGTAQAYPLGHSAALLAISERLSSSAQLLCATRRKEIPDALTQLMEERGAGLSVLLKTPENEALLGQLAPFTAACSVPPEGAAYSFCQNGACALPVDDLARVRALLEQQT